ncbi:hypothetical protein [Soonwooa sp.]|uniref:hypothetical protein n=1 Tax=Soonwooa sp. TaxID=1938592 RepID=UPI00261A23C9|nr:hypothetical protein [Soonwooa sp.]
MEKKQDYSDLPTEELQVLRDKQKKMVIAFGSIWLVLMLVYFGIIAYKGFSRFNIATAIPIFVLPITLLPIYTTFATIDKELKSRKK